MHTDHWLKYLLLSWPVVSLILTPFVVRFLAMSSDDARPALAPDDEVDIVMLDLATPVQPDGLTTFPRERA